jgi:hypothetical protein
LKVEGQTEEQYWNLIREYMTDEVQERTRLNPVRFVVELQFVPRKV